MISAIASVTILTAVATVHIYWAAGGAFGKSAAIPENNNRPVLKPGRGITLAVAACLVAAAILVGLRAGMLPRGVLGWGPRLATWAIAVVFAARAIGDFRYVGFFKRVRGTRFARMDTLFYSPLCCLLALLVAQVARS